MGNVVGGINNVDVQNTVGIQATLVDGNVSPTPGQALLVDVRGFLYDLGGLRGAYNGAVAQSVTDDDTTYVYLDRTASLQITTVGYPTDAMYIPLARIVAANGEIAMIYNEKVLLAASSSTIGTCRISYPVDGDIRGGATSARFAMMLVLTAGTGSTGGRRRTTSAETSNSASTTPGRMPSATTRRASGSSTGRSGRSATRLELGTATTCRCSMSRAKLRTRCSTRS